MDSYPWPPRNLPWDRCLFAPISWLSFIPRSAMESPALQPVTVSFRGFAARVILGCVAGSLLAFAWGILSLQLSTADALNAAFSACAIWLFASGLAVIALTAITGGDLHKLPMAALFTSGARMLLAIGLATLLYFAVPVDAKTYWASFLLAGLVSLVAETSWTIRALSALNRPLQSTHAAASVSDDHAAASGVR